jgi:hypothetical protein
MAEGLNGTSSHSMPHYSASHVFYKVGAKGGYVDYAFMAHDISAEHNEGVFEATRDAEGCMTGIPAGDVLRADRAVLLFDTLLHCRRYILPLLRDRVKISLRLCPSFGHKRRSGCRPGSDGCWERLRHAYEALCKSVRIRNDISAVGIFGREDIKSPGKPSNPQI